MNTLVELVNNEIVTSSRRVAEVFGKEHKDVLESVRNILTSENSYVKAENSALTGMFHKSTYKAGTGKDYPEYLMNRDGFSLLVMGFTGAKALEWKLKYISAFKAMEKQIKNATEKPRLNNPGNDAMTDIENTSATIERLFKVKHGMALAAAMEFVGSIHAVDMSPLRPLLPSVKDHGFLNPTAIGERLGGVKASIVNKMLFGLGLQYKSEKGWRLTDDGFLYGEEKPYTRNGHSGYQIVWNEKIMEALK